MAENEEEEESGMTQEKPQLREKWMFITDIPLLFPTESVTKQMRIDIILSNKDVPMVVRGVETAETVMNAMKEMRLITPEELKHDREVTRGYIV